MIFVYLGFVLPYLADLGRGASPRCGCTGRSSSLVGQHPVQDQRDLDILQSLHELQERLVVQLGEDASGLLRPQQTEDSHEIGQ